MADDVPAERPGSQVERWLSVGASVVAPVTVLSTVLFYFGYVSSQAQYEYFGIDVDTIGLSTQDYVMRSPRTLLAPALALIMLGAALVALHLTVSSRLAGREQDPAVRRVVRRGTLAGVVVLCVGLGLIVAYAVIGDWRYYDLVTPVVIALGAGLVAYGWRWQTVSAAALATTAPTLRRMGVVLLVLLVATTVFWSTATIARWTGRGVARSAATHLSDLPSVILDTKERLFLRSPGVEETTLPVSPGQTFRFRYRHLRLLVHGPDRMFLVPDAWSASDSTLVVAMDPSVRVQFQFQNDPP